MQKDKKRLINIRDKIADCFSKAQKSLAVASVDCGLKREWPFLVAIGWRIAMRPSRKMKTKDFGRKKLVILNKSAGIDDVQ